MSNSFDVIVVIVCYNSENTIELAIQSINEGQLRLKIIVLDNFSSDNSIEKITNLKDERVILLKSKENLGFAGGCNYIFDYANTNFNSNYLFLFNPDAICEINCIYKLIDTFAINPKIAIVSPKINFLNGDPWYSGALIDWQHMQIINNPVIENSDSCREIDVFNGCTALIKTKIIQDFGGFNTNLFMYYDEADFSIKLKSLGCQIYYNPNITIKHDVSHSTKNMSYIKSYYITRNYLYVFLKNRPYNISISIMIVGKNVFRNIISFVYRGNFKNIRYSILGAFHYFIKRNGKL